MMRKEWKEATDKGLTIQIEYNEGLVFLWREDGTHWKYNYDLHIGKQPFPSTIEARRPYTSSWHWSSGAFTAYEDTIEKELEDFGEIVSWEIKPKDYWWELEELAMDMLRAAFWAEIDKKKGAKQDD